MLRSVSDLKQFTIAGTDGSLGGADSSMLNEESVRHLWGMRRADVAGEENKRYEPASGRSA